MKRDAMTPFVIFSAMKGRQSLSDSINTETVAQILTSSDVKYKKVVGKYKDSEEISFLVHAKHLPLASELAAKYNQTALFLVDAYRNAQVISVPDGEILKTGEYVRIPAHMKDEVDGWTLDPETGQYWTLK